jgi:hypothetical protein
MLGEGWNIEDEDVYMGICVICNEGRRIRLLNDPSPEAKRLLVPLCKTCWDRRRAMRTDKIIELHKQQ